MKIGFDARAAYGNPAGKGQMVAGLLKAFLSTNSEHKFYVFLKEDQQLPVINLEKVIIKLPSLLWHLSAAHRAKELGLDIYISPSSFIVPALLKKIKTLIVVHDLVAFIKIAYHQKKATIIEKVTLSRAIKNCWRVVSVSESTKRDLLRIFPFAQGKVTVIYSGNPLGEIEGKSWSEVKNKYTIPEKFLLTVGTLEPRKNPRGIMEGYKAYLEIAGSDFLPLVVVGKRGWRSEIYCDLVKELELQGKVYFVEYVSRENLVAFYKHALCFLFPSLYEGFGFPVVEAMSLGCPVITSNTSSLPEAGGSAAYYTDPNDYVKIGKGLYDIIKNPSFRQKLNQAGLAQAEKFKWEKAARKYLDLIQSA